MSHTWTTALIAQFESAVNPIETGSLMSNIRALLVRRRLPHE